MAFTHATSMMLLSALSLPPAIASFAYFRMSPETESVVQRLAVSAHGVTISMLCPGTLLIGGFGHSQQQYGPLFGLLYWVPVTLIGYSFWQFRGKKAVHFLQIINLVWLFLALLFGGMAVTGVWL